MSNRAGGERDGGGEGLDLFYRVPMQGVAPWHAHGGGVKVLE